MATYSIKILKDENNTPFIPLVDSRAIVVGTTGDTLEKQLQSKLETTDIVAGEHINILKQGNTCTFSAQMPSGLNVINNLTTNNAGIGVLDAYQGKILKDSIPQVINNLTTIDDSKSLSAYQGYLLDQKISNISLTPGPKGDKGEPGPKGDKGDTGPTDFSKIYPVGSIYMSVINSDPHGLFGGEWKRLSGGFLYGAQTSWGTGNGTGTDTGNGGNGTTGEHILTVEEMPNHSHDFHCNSGGNGPVVIGDENPPGWHEEYFNVKVDLTSSKPPAYLGSAGGDKGHSHTLSSHTHPIPYIAVFVWQRIK